MIQIGDYVRILPTAFGDSTEPEDVAVRGLTGQVAYDLETEFGADFTGCWVVEVAGREVHVSADEVEVLESEGQ